jgi:hypothetical protein
MSNFSMVEKKQYQPGVEGRNLVIVVIERY